jgi:hypothetical protein
MLIPIQSQLDKISQIECGACKSIISCNSAPIDVYGVPTKDWKILSDHWYCEEAMGICDIPEKIVCGKGKYNYK